MPTTFQAPGRVNLIGEHTDYTGGLVMPMAIPFTTSAAIRAVPAGFEFTSGTFDTTRKVEQLERSKPAGDWTDYPVGVTQQLLARGIAVPPFALHLEGDVPPNAGLSSSASVEVSTAMAVLHHAGVTLPEAEIASLCQRAENEFVGSPCGIMDQFVSTAARAGHALLLHTRSLEYEQLPLNTGSLAQCRIVVANSMVKHSIAGGDYGVRRREVEAGQAVLKQRFPELRDLGDATLEQLGACEEAMSPESFKRCRHIISENGRVLEAKKAMLAGDATRLGERMTEAHASERDDFECSVAEVDFLVDTATAQPGCHGARLTGGGFGGCTVNLVETAAVDAFQKALTAAYQQKFGIAAEIYVCEAVDGAMARAESGEVTV